MINARKKHKKELKKLIADRKSIVDSLLGTTKEEIVVENIDTPPQKKFKVKLYETD